MKLPPAEPTRRWQAAGDVVKKSCVHIRTPFRQRQTDSLITDQKCGTRRAKSWVTRQIDRISLIVFEDSRCGVLGPQITEDRYAYTR
jgi:hypothetical protein